LLLTQLSLAAWKLRKCSAVIVEGDGLHFSIGVTWVIVIWVCKHTTYVLVRLNVCWNWQLLDLLKDTKKKRHPHRGTYHNKTADVKLTAAGITATVTVPTICRLNEWISNISIMELKQKRKNKLPISQFEMQ
jgi:hypothetical protein